VRAGHCVGGNSLHPHCITSNGDHPHGPPATVSPVRFHLGGQATPGGDSDASGDDEDEQEDDEDEDESLDEEEAEVCR